MPSPSCGQGRASWKPGWKRGYWQRSGVGLPMCGPSRMLRFQAEALTGTVGGAFPSDGCQLNPRARMTLIESGAVNWRVSCRGVAIADPAQNMVIALTNIVACVFSASESD